MTFSITAGTYDLTQQNCYKDQLALQHLFAQAERDIGNQVVLCPSLWDLYLRNMFSIRQVGRFTSSLYKYTKTLFVIVTNLREIIKKFMATGIAQRSCTDLFPLWSHKKNDIPKMKKQKKYCKVETQKALKEVLVFKWRTKNKKYT